MTGAATSRREEVRKMYKLLCAYAAQFGADFPISQVMANMNEYEAMRAIEECIETNTAYAASAATAST